MHEDVGSPQWGPRKCPLLAIPCVTLSLILFALGDADLTGGFCLRTLSFASHSTIMGPILDMFIVSRDVVGTSCEVLERHANLSLLPLLLRLYGPIALPPWC
jgi:hypothetical protein